ncbi:MAG: NYN domain-containing protein [Elusimicrobiota bacterium]
MRTYLVDGTNVVRRSHYDPRFPEMEEFRTQGLLGRLNALAVGVCIELFLDGPRRAVGPAGPVRVRFALEGEADEAILGTVRSIRNKGKGVVVVTGDGPLAQAAREEGARIMGFGEFQRRLESGKA